MSASAQSIQARNTATANQAAQNLKQSVSPNADNPNGFGNLFASALSGLNPQAKLSTIQEEMREALNQNTPKKTQTNNDNLAYAGQQQAADAAVWAQRAWMNPAPAQTASSTPSAAPAKTTPAKTVNPDQSGSKPETVKSQEDKPASEQPKATATQDKPAESDKTQDNTAAQADKGKGDSAPADKQTASPDIQRAGTDTLEVQAQSQTQTPEADVKMAKAGPAKADLTLSASSGTDKPDTTVDLKGPATQTQQVLHPHATQIARSAATQAMQVAQQAQALGKQGQEFTVDSKGLQAGDKILATGASTASAAGNPAAGLMGLGTTRSGLAGEALIKTPVNQPGFVKELAQQVNWTIGKNLSTVDIRVNPESFGPMNMRLVQKGQEVHLVIRTQDDQSAAMMTQAVHGLKEALAQSGLQLGQVQIHGSAADAQNAFANLQQQAQGQQQAGGGNGQQRGGNGQPDGDQAEMDATHKASASKAGNNGLDLFA